jgi:HEAT repeat protein
MMWQNYCASTAATNKLYENRAMLSAFSQSEQPMNNTHSFFNRICHSLIPRRAAIMLVTLAWSSLAFCGEIQDAAKSGDLEKVKALLKDNPDLVSSKDSYGYTPLYYAARYGHKDVAQLLLANHAEVNAKDNYGLTPLHWAMDHKDIAELLLAKGADVNSKTIDGRTPLHIAAQHGSKNVVELLLAKHADVNANDDNGKTPLDAAVYMGYMDVAELLRQHGGQHGDLEKFESLLKDNGYVSKSEAEKINFLTACLKDKDSDVRLFAIEEMSKLGDAQAVEPLIACLNDQGSVAWIRRSAIEALVKLGKPAVEPLIGCLKDCDFDVCRALGELGDARAVEPLIACLKANSSTFDTNGTRPAAEALSKLGKPAVAPLIRCLKDQDSYVRQSAAETLEKLGYIPETETEKITFLIATESWDELAKQGKPAIEPLIGCLKDQDQDVSQFAVKALEKLGDKRAVEPLIACLCIEDQSPDVRQSAAEAVGKLGDARAIKPLRAALPDWDANEFIWVALEQLGWQPKPGAEQLYFWIGKRDAQAINIAWEKNKQLLLADVKSGNRRKIENAVCTFVSLGKEEEVPALVRILNSQGNKQMAETYINCGHEGLAQAARSWAERHGYSISTGAGANKAGWGQWK